MKTGWEIGDIGEGKNTLVVGLVFKHVVPGIIVFRTTW